MSNAPWSRKDNHGRRTIRLNSLAAGADGLIIEVHPHPELAMSDGAQSLKPERFAALVTELKKLAPAVGRTL